MSISATMVKELRTKTGAGILDCRKALAENDGDVEKAVDWLRAKGAAKAAKKASRAATEGSVQAYIHAGGKLGVLVEINCETDFVARGEEFQDFVKDVSMHIAASNPGWVSREDVPSDVLDREKKVFIQQALEAGKPEHIAEKMVEPLYVQIRPCRPNSVIVICPAGAATTMTAAVAAASDVPTAYTCAVFIHSGAIASPWSRKIGLYSSGFCHQPRMLVTRAVSSIIASLTASASFHETVRPVVTRAAAWPVNWFATRFARLFLGSKLAPFSQGQ